jgi:hypothetical protein
MYDCFGKKQHLHYYLHDRSKALLESLMCLEGFEPNSYNVIIIVNASINHYQVVKTSMPPSYCDDKTTIVAIIHC